MNVREIKVPVGRMIEDRQWKIFRSPTENFDFNKLTGFSCSWGATKETDIEAASFPHILDIEITTNCNGPDNKLCPFCYKGNNPNGYNMPFEHFKTIIDKMPWLTQCALGADAQGTTNPDMFKMMHYARKRGIIPNLTIADVSPAVADELVRVAGAVAVSVYSHAGFDVAFNSIKNLKDAAAKVGRTNFDINIHYMISSRTIEKAYKLIEAYQTDERLKGMNAIVFLGLKAKGRGKKFDTVTITEYKELVETCLDKGIPFGFDSCSAPTFLEAVKDHENFDKFLMMSEPCESTCISSYINEKGEFYPCSFTEGEGNWETGIDVLSANDFVKDVWNHERTQDFRNALLTNLDDNKCRNCPVHVVCGKDMRTEAFITKVGTIL